MLYVFLKMRIIINEEEKYMVTINKIKENIYQIKVIDTQATTFHGCLFPVLEGTSYGCYLLIDEQITLLDTVEAPYFTEAFDKINDLIAGRKIDNIVVNHAEPDHSGAFALVMEKYPDAKVYTSKTGHKALKNMFFKDYDYHEVGYGDSLNIGKYNLLFMETPLVHWPDNMWVYLPEEEILFSNDAFGQLISDDAIYDSEVGVEKLLAFSREYYANIVWPNNRSVPPVIKKFVETNWKVSLIAPSHGVIIKDYISNMLEQYQSFAANTIDDKKALVVYETIWGNTKMMADTIATTLEEEGYHVKKYQISQARISEVISEMIDTKLLVLGTGNHNNCLMPPVADFLERVKASHFFERDAIAFGAYGWAQIPFNDLKGRLEKANFNVLGEPITINFTPSKDEQKGIKTMIKGLLKK